MALRELIDAEGTVWQIWNVRPTTRYSSPLKRAERRVKQAQHVYPDRRKKLSLNPGLETGWLCFDSGDQKRRLIPAPADWSTCAEEVLAGYLETARPIRRVIYEQHAGMEQQPPFA